MIRRSTWVILAILVGLILIAVIVSRRNSNQSPAITPTAFNNNLVSESIVEIVSVRFENDTDEYLELRRENNDGWILVNPEGEILDTSVIENAVTQFATTRILSELIPAPSRNATGLDKPGVVIHLGYLNGEKDTFIIGNKTQTDSGYYVLSGEDKVYVVTPSGIDSLVRIIDNPNFISEQK